MQRRMSIKEAREYLENNGYPCARNTLVNYATKGYISYTLVGTKRRFLKEDLDTFLDGKKVKGDKCYAKIAEQGIEQKVS
jgi:hypothetical protein